MKRTSKDLRKIFLDKTNNMEYNFEKSRGVRNMSLRLHEEFDKIWVKYNNNEATYDQWNKALDKWLSSERI